MDKELTVPKWVLLNWKLTLKIRFWHFLTAIIGYLTSLTKKSKSKISEIMASIWKVLIKFRWHDEKLTLVIYLADVTHANIVRFSCHSDLQFPDIASYLLRPLSRPLNKVWCRENDTKFHFPCDFFYDLFCLIKAINPMWMYRDCSVSYASVFPILRWLSAI